MKKTYTLIVSLMIMSTLFARIDLNNLTVSGDGTGSFLTISDAIFFVEQYVTSEDYNNEDIRIVVSAGTYGQINLMQLPNTYIPHFTIEGIGEVIIDGTDYGAYIYAGAPPYYWSRYYLKNLKIINAQRGIVFIDSWRDWPPVEPHTPHIYLEVSDCSIYDCGTDNFQSPTDIVTSSASIHMEGAGLIKNCIIEDNVNTTYNSSHYHEYCQAGGPFIKNNSLSSTTLENCIISGNIGGLSGGLVVNGTGEIIIRDNEFTENQYGEYCNISYTDKGNALSIFSAQKVSILRNRIHDNLPSTTPYGNIVALYADNNASDYALLFKNNTIVNTPLYQNNGLAALKLNRYSGGDAQDVKIINNIFSSTNSNGCEVKSLQGCVPSLFEHNILHNSTLAGITANLYYPDNPSGPYDPTITRLNFVCDPNLTTNHIPRWDSSLISFCIDNGYGEHNLDETPSDIGAILASDHDYRDYSMPYGNSTNIKWMSFPVLNEYTTGYTTNSNFFAPIISTTVLDWVDWKVEDDPQLRMQYDIGGLQYGNNTVTSPVGYKVKLLSGVNNEILLRTTGYIESPTTTLHLYKYLQGTTTINENWLGYFLPEPCNVLEAFSPILSYITSITAQYWSATQIFPGVWLGNAGSRVLNPGDMVIVKVNQNCSFSWNNGQPVEPDYIKAAKNFSFTEKADYTPLYIAFEEDKSLELPDEIGLYVNGVCKGAAVVEGPEAQICAYLDANEDITPENSELVFWYDNKAASQNRIKCSFSSETLKKKQLQGHLFYSFEVDSKANLDNIVPVTTLAQNYPNPFNPRTLIAFELAEAGPVTIEIYNIRGQKVNTLVNTDMVSGKHQVEWNGTDKYGRKVASGIYQYRLITQDKSITRKMLLMK